jgi:hypothetical protein
LIERNKTFDQVTKNAFDQTPNLTETFDQVKRSSEIRSTDPLSNRPLINLSKYGVDEIFLFFK